MEAELDTALFLNKPPFKVCFSLWKRVVLVVYFPLQEVFAMQMFLRAVPPLPRDGVSPSTVLGAESTTSSTCLCRKGYRLYIGTATSHLKSFH